MRYKERGVTKVDFGVLVGKIQARWNGFVPQCQKNLDQTGDSGGGQSVANIGLDRTERAVATAVRLKAECIGECVDLDRIAKLCSSAVRFDQPDCRRADACPTIDHLLQRCLCRTARSCNAAGPSVLINSRCLDHADDLVPVGQGLIEAFEHDDANALSWYESICFGVECVALAGGRQHAGIVQKRMQAMVCHKDRHAAGERHIAVARQQALARQVDGHQ